MKLSGSLRNRPARAAAAKVWGIGEIVILVLFIAGVQLISPGIIGEYISLNYKEVRNRPKFIVEYPLGLTEHARS
jgi:hypothetical protein